MNPYALTIAGLVLDIIGAVLVALFLPLEAFFYVENDDLTVDGERQAEYRRRKKVFLAGVWLLVAGFALQLVSALLQGKIISLG